MKNTGKFSRIFFALILSLSLGVAPTLSVYAQQGTHKQPSPQAKSSAEKPQQATEEKEQLSEGELLPLSDAEMEKVEGGFAFVVPALWFAGSVVAGVAGNAIYNHFHKSYCTPTRRR
jgi:hypothetical protein